MLQPDTPRPSTDGARCPEMPLRGVGPDPRRPPRHGGDTLQLQKIYCQVRKVECCNPHTRSNHLPHHHMDGHKALSAPFGVGTAPDRALRPAKPTAKSFCEGELLAGALGEGPGHPELLQARPGHAVQSRPMLPTPGSLYA